MLIDAHQHAYWLDRDADSLVAEMDQLGIDIAWLLTWNMVSPDRGEGYFRAADPRSARADGSHAGMELSGVIEARDRHPTRFVAGYCPPTPHPSAADYFEDAYRVHGVRVCGEWSYTAPLDDPRAIELFRRAGSLGCPVVLHMDVPFLPPTGPDARYTGNWKAGTTHHLERALQACPDTVFLGHCPGFWRDFSGDGDTSAKSNPEGPITPGGRLHRLFDDYPNLHADLSANSGLNALTRDVDFSRQFIIKHADRLLFGRDRYGSQLIEFLQTLDLPYDVWRKVSHENALRLAPIG